MYQKVDLNLTEDFHEAAGGKTNATLLIMKELNCSLSKAGKLAAGRYPSKISASEFDRLIALMKRTIRGPLSPRQRASGKSAS